MNEKVKCKKCGLLIDSDMPYCPYCGYSQKENEKHEIKEHVHCPFCGAENNKESTYCTICGAKINSTNSNQVTTNEMPTKKGNVFAFETKILDVPIWKKILCFVAGRLFLKVIVLVLQLFIDKNADFYFIFSNTYSGAINFAVYLILFGLFIILFNEDILKVLKEFKKSDVWINGFAYGFSLILISSAVSALMNLIPHGGVNNNQTSINGITDLFPFLSILIFGFIGPIVEEFTYRVGFFGLFRKINPILAYVLTAILFGFIHFDFNSADLVNEFINIPSYIVAGLLLCYIYDYKGIGASILAHITNNFIGLIIQIILINVI